MNIGTIAVIGSILAGLISLPAMSASITGDVTAAGAELSGMSPQEFEDAPRTVSETVTATSMQKTVETAFGRVDFESTADSFHAQLESAEHALDVKRTAGTEEISFTAGQADLAVTETADRVATVCSTPRGTLETVHEDGGETVTFSGTGRDHVRATCDTATAEMEAQIERVQGLAVHLGLVLPDVAVTRVNASKESVTIENTGTNDVALDGWNLTDGGSVFSGFDGVVLTPDGTVTVYSKQAIAAEDCEESDGPDHALCWDSSYVWNDGGETVTLISPQGETVDTYTYG